MNTPLRTGDVVWGPSIGSPVRRTWLVLVATDDGQMAIGQNRRAKKPFRQPLRAEGGEGRLCRVQR